MTRFLRVLSRWAAGACLLVPALGAHAQAQPPLPTKTLQSGMYLIHAEVAASPESRERGLMFRDTLAPNQGMLFIFDEAGSQCMWMRNTLIPLSVAFIGDDGAIINIEDMAPQTENSHCASRPVRYALEMEGGWFAKRGLKAGSKITGITR
jgi:hypothetical protein